MICSQNIGAPFALAVHVVQRAEVALERDKLNISLVIDCRARFGSGSHIEIKKVLKRQEIALCTTDVANFRSLL